LIGPRSLAGNFDPASLELRDANGISIRQAMTDFGLDPDAIPQLDRRNRAIIGYVETHIEQGPVLEADDHPVGLVTSICGIERHRLTLCGKPGHAGTVPMALRADALAGAAEMIVEVERHARDTEGLIATVGQIAVGPNAVNVIPASVEFLLEVRSPADDLRRESAAHIIKICVEIAKDRSLELTSDFTYEQGAQPCDGKLLAELEAATRAVHGQVPSLPSGATHDASAMSELCPMAMLFVRCRDGASHLPEEFASEADMEVARRTLSQLVRNLADEYG
jgi:allantoate deiminase